MPDIAIEKQRLRAPSKRSLATKQRILDSAEILFAERGFEGASIRDIARAAGVQGALVQHHGGSKEQLFAAVVARRAGEISELRLGGLNALKTQRAPELRDILDCFVAPLFDKARTGDKGWIAYGRLVAHVSADERWRDLAKEWFDPTATIFIQAIADVFPRARKESVAASFVFMVSSSLAIFTSSWRIAALSSDDGGIDLKEELLSFATAGFAGSCRSDLPTTIGKA